MMNARIKKDTNNNDTEEILHEIYAIQFTRRVPFAVCYNRTFGMLHYLKPCCDKILNELFNAFFTVYGN